MSRLLPKRPLTRPCDGCPACGYAACAARAAGASLIRHRPIPPCSAALRTCLGRSAWVRSARCGWAPRTTARSGPRSCCSPRPRTGAVGAGVVGREARWAARVLAGPARAGPQGGGPAVGCARPRSGAFWVMRHAVVMIAYPVPAGSISAQPCHPSIASEFCIIHLTFSPLHRLLPAGSGSSRSWSSPPGLCWRSLGEQHNTRNTYRAGGRCCSSKQSARRAWPPPSGTRAGRRWSAPPGRRRGQRRAGMRAAPLMHHPPRPDPLPGPTCPSLQLHPSTRLPSPPLPPGAQPRVLPLLQRLPLLRRRGQLGGHRQEPVLPLLHGRRAGRLSHRGRQARARGRGRGGVWGGVGIDSWRAWEGLAGNEGSASGPERLEAAAG